MTPPTSEIRCNCGRLLARRTETGVQLKCRRCGRYWEVALADLSDEPREIGATETSGDK